MTFVVTMPGIGRLSISCVIRENRSPPHLRNEGCRDYALRSQKQKRDRTSRHFPRKPEQSHYGHGRHRFLDLCLHIAQRLRENGKRKFPVVKYAMIVTLYSRQTTN